MGDAQQLHIEALRLDYRERVAPFPSDRGFRGVWRSSRKRAHTYLVVDRLGKLSVGLLLPGGTIGLLRYGTAHAARIIARLSLGI